MTPIIESRWGFLSSNVTKKKEKKKGSRDGQFDGVAKDVINHNLGLVLQISKR